MVQMYLHIQKAKYKLQIGMLNYKILIINDIIKQSQTLPYYNLIFSFMLRLFKHSCLKQLTLKVNTFFHFYAISKSCSLC